MIEDGVLIAYIGSEEEVVIPEGVTCIGSYAFRGSSLKSIEIPEGVTSIGDSAFNGCTSLTSIKLPESVTEICYEEVEGEGEFDDCEGLRVCYCVEGSYAETYMKKYYPRITCLLIGSVQPPDTEMPESEITASETVTPQPSESEKETPQPSESETETPQPSESETVTPQPSESEARSPKSSETGSEETETPNSESPKSQTITVKTDIKKTYGAKPFSLGAKTDGGGKLNFKSSNEKVATVNAAGKVTIKGYGKISITVTAAATDGYKKAEKKVTLTVLPKTPTVTSTKSGKKKTVTVKWKKDAKAAGYILEYSTNKKFKKDVKTLTIVKNKTVSKKITKLKSGRKYYVRLCAYTNTGGKKIKGAYSVVKQVNCK